MVILRGLRQRLLLFWVVVLLYMTLVTAFWIVRFQPVWGKAISVNGVIYWLVAGFIGYILLFYRASRSDYRAAWHKVADSKRVNVMISLTTIALILIVAELALRVFMVQSDGFAFTAMHRAWVDLYWHPLNSLEYRDHEPISDASRQHILVLGDSFPSGHGIASIADTFPGQLDRMLGDDYAVNIAAQPGWDTMQQLVALSEYPILPDLVILSYFYNDISYTLPENPVTVRFPEPPWRLLVDDFFLGSFVYWHILAGGNPGYGAAYQRALQDAYTLDEYWNEQQTTLGRMIQWTQDRNIALLVLLWDDLGNIQTSRDAILQVADYFEGQGIPVVDVTPALQGMPRDAIVVNAFDAHPNVQVHKIAAQLLEDAIRRQAAGD